MSCSVLLTLLPQVGGGCWDVCIEFARSTHCGTVLCLAVQQPAAQPARPDCESATCFPTSKVRSLQLAKCLTHLDCLATCRYLAILWQVRASVHEVASPENFDLVRSILVDGKLCENIVRAFDGYVVRSYQRAHICHPFPWLCSVLVFYMLHVAYGLSWSWHGR